MPSTPRTCIVYRGSGVRDDELSTQLAPLERELPRHAPVAGRVTHRRIMSRDLVCARADLALEAVVALMMRHRVGCLPIVDENRRPVGVITKFDLVEQLDAAMRAAHAREPLPPELAARTAGDLMVPVALTLHDGATVAHAAAMMMTEETHHVLVVDRDGILLGVVSAKDVVRWVVDHDVLAVRRERHNRRPAWHPLEG